MDPVTQGVVGAAFAQTRGPNQTLAKAAAIGAFAGMVPDLDVLIRSSTDPLLAVDFHRHFTHSVFFIPIGGLLCSLLLYPLLGKRWQLSYRQILVWCLIGFATHGVLDGFTTFGTQLLWPFDDRRYALDIISVVDPMFTVPLLAMVVLAAVTRTRRYAGWALLGGAVDLSVGYVQHQRAETMGIELAEGRGHKVLRLEVKPTIGNLAVWKVVYEADERLFVDAVKPGLFKPVVWQGDSVRKLDVQRDFPWLDPGSQQARDIGRFHSASVGYLAVDPNDNQRIGDVRYSMLPQRISPLWGIELSPDAGVTDHVDFYTRRDNGRAAVKRIAAMMFE